MSSTLDFLENTTDWRSQAGGLAIIAALHGAALGVLLYFHAAQPALPASNTITVSLIAAPAPEVVEPQPEPPKPVVKKIDEPKKLLVAETPAPSAFTAPPPDPPMPPPPPTAPPAANVADQPVIQPTFETNYATNPITYPPQARRAGEQGRVLLHVLVDTNGLPAKIEIKQSSGYAQLDNAAIEAVKHWKFTPARQGPLPVEAWATVPISFSLTQ